MTHVVMVVGLKQRGAVLFESQGEAVAFRNKVKDLHPELNVMAAPLLDKDSTVNWARFGD